MKRQCKRLAALLLAALLLSNAALGAGALPEEFSIYDATLKSLESTAGELRRSTYGDTYTLILGPEEVSFTLMATPAESDPAVGPELTIDGELTGYGRPSQRFDLENGARRTVEITVKPQGGGAGTYRVQAYRTPTRVEARGIISEPQEDGSRQLALEFRIPAGTDFKVLMLSLAFDPEQLQLCNPKTNKPSETLGYVTEFPGDFLYRNSSGVFQTLGGSKADNKNGRLLLQFGVHDEAAAESYRVQAGEEAVVTAYFRIAPEGAVTEESLRLDTQSSAVHGGFSLTERAADGTYVSGVSCPGLVEFTGIRRALSLPEEEPEGGALALTPDRAWYGFGEQVTITPVADSGWRFTGWSAADGATLPPGLDLTAPELTVRLLEDMDLTALRPSFERLDEGLPSGRGLDFTAPYVGEAVILVNPAYGQGQQAGGQFQESGADGADSAVDLLEETEEPVWTEPAETLSGPAEPSLTAAAVEAEADVGARRQFQVRDARISDSGSQEAWESAPFLLREVRQVGEKRLCLWLCDDPAWQPMNLTEEALSELADSFAESMEAIERDFHSLADANGNGALDLLLYDIRDGYSDGGSAYNGGFFSQYEFFGILGPESGYGVGNNGDVLHLDTWPQLGPGFVPTAEGMEKLKSTLAHEAQHMALASSLGSRTEYATVPKWINEGLSMTAEHALFGPLESRIAKFGTIRGGHSLTEWSASNDPEVTRNYALSYLFFQYVKNQAGRAGFARDFYRAYPNERAAVSEVLQGIPAFAGKSFDEVLSCFYLALYLKEDTGLYGFGAENDVFAGAQPFLLDALPAGEIPSGGAAYVTSPGQFTPEGAGTLRIASVSTPVHSLTVEPSEGGAVRAAGDRYSYRHGETAVLTAVPAEGYTFTGWAGDAAGTDNPLSLAMDGAKSVTAQFAPIPRYALTVECGVGGRITAQDADGTLLDDLSALYAGTWVTLTALPDPGCVFTGWAGDASGKAPELTVTVEGDLAVSASFRTALPVPPDSLVTVPEGWTLTPDPAGKRVTLQMAGTGTVTLAPAEGAFATDGTVAEGTEMTARAQAAEGMAFDHWVLHPVAAPLAMEGAEASYSPTLRYRAGEVRPEAVFRAVRADAPLLANLRLTAPAGRGLIGSESRNTGFSSGEFEYDLSLLSAETALSFYAVCKRGTEAELQLLRDGKPVGAPIPVADSLDGVTADDPGALDTLTPLYVKEVADGDVLRVTVWNREDAERENLSVYQLDLHVAEHDPGMQAVFQPSTEAGPALGGAPTRRWELALYLQNIQAEAAQITLSVPRGVLLPLDEAGAFAALDFVDGAADLTAYCQEIWNPRYRLSKATLYRAAEGPDRLVLVFEKAALEESPVYEPEPVRVVKLPFATAEAGTGWMPGRGAVAAYDTNRLELELSVRVTRYGDITLTGAFTAWNPRDTYAPQDEEGAWRVYALREDDPELIAPQAADTVVLADEGEPMYGRRTFRFTFDHALEPGTYTLVLRKPCHTSLTVEHLILTEDEPEVDLNALLADALPETGGALALYAGDVDGDGRVTAYDKLELTGLDWFGQGVEYGGAAPDPNARYDLDGDGRVTAFDLQILTDHYGRGPVRLALPVDTTEKGA